MSSKSLMYRSPNAEIKKITQVPSAKVVKGTSKNSNVKDKSKVDQTLNDGSNIDNSENVLIDKNEEIHSVEIIQDTKIDDEIVNDEVNQDTSVNDTIDDLK